MQPFNLPISALFLKVNWHEERLQWKWVVRWPGGDQLKRDGNEIEERIGSDEKELRSELFSGRAELKDNSDPYNYH